MNFCTKSNVMVVLKEIAQSKHQSDDLKERALECIRRIYVEDSMPETKLDDEFYTPYRNTFAEIQSKAITVKTEFWKCKYCNHINTVAVGSMKIMNEGGTIISTCKGCDSRFMLVN